MNAVNPVLARKLGLNTGEGDEAASPELASPARQMRRAMARAADKSVGLSAVVLGMAEDEADVEDLIDNGPANWVVLGLRESGQAGLSGLVLIDPGLRSALVEMQTMGSLLPPADAPRPITRIDALMTVPFASQLLAELVEAGFRTGGPSLAQYEIGPIDDLRTAGLIMVQGRYTSWSTSVQIGGGDLQGEIQIAVLPQIVSDAPEPASASNWSDALRSAVSEAPIELDAVLGRLRMPIAAVEGFEVGQVLPLPGTTVGSITLTAPSGEEVAGARLGQISGKRAVRLEEAPVELQPDMPPLGAATSPQAGTPTASLEQGGADPQQADGV